MLKSVTSTPQVITYLVYSNCLVSIRYLFRRLIFVTFDAVILKLRVWPHVYLEHYSALKFLVSILIMGKALGNFTCRRFLMSYQITYSNHGFKKSLKKFITWYHQVINLQLIFSELCCYLLFLQGMGCTARSCNISLPWLTQTCICICLLLWIKMYNYYIINSIITSIIKCACTALSRDYTPSH